MLLLSAAVALAAGCGEAGETQSGTGEGPAGSGAGTAPTTVVLDGRSFAVTALDGRRPIAGSGAGITFEDGRIAVTTGCNGISGPYELADGRLRAPDLTATTMACEPPLTEQEEALRTLLESRPRVTFGGATLTLTGDDGRSLVLVARERATGPRPIAGTRWVLETIAAGRPDGTASSVPAGVEPPTLRIAANGTVELFAGCNRGGGRAVVRDDGFVVFGPLALTRIACDRAATAVEAAVTAVLDGRVAAAFTGEDRLLLTKAGRSLTFRAAG